MVRILKIGGSVLTDKARPTWPREDVIARLAPEVAMSASDLILVHGAGSYGHVPAKRFGLPERFDPVGLLETHRSVAELNWLVLDALSRAGARPVPVHPLSCVLLRDGRIVKMDLSPIEAMVKKGLLPVLHGDVAVDSSRGSGIVSGDQLISYIAANLSPDVVALGTDVDGIICDGTVLSRVGRADIKGLEAHLGTGPGTDVTGGMRGKLLELLDLADLGVRSQIFNATVSGNVRRALRGEHVGTEVN